MELSKNDFACEKLDEIRTSTLNTSKARQNRLFSKQDFCWIFCLWQNLCMSSKSLFLLLSHFLLWNEDDSVSLDRINCKSSLSVIARFFLSFPIFSSNSDCNGYIWWIDILPWQQLAYKLVFCFEQNYAALGSPCGREGLQGKGS